tara:strand:- start:656 stop:1096 length:441 start_codon:yes stop_codon:yes gene_type:complete
MSYSSTICRKCEKNTYVNLEDSGYLCASCLKEINDDSSFNITDTEEELDLKKSVRWLQSWLIVENVTSTSVIISWLPPEFLSRSAPDIDEYYVYTIGGELSKIIKGNITQVIFENLKRDYSYEFRVKGIVKGKFLKEELKKNYYLR